MTTLAIGLIFVNSLFLFLFLSSSLVYGESVTDWKIADYVLDSTDPEGLQKALEMAKKAEEEHEKVVRRVGRETKFSRTNNLTEALAHNYMIKLALEVAANQAEESRASSEPGFFRDVCLNLSSELSACSEPCEELRYRTFTGCCNNLDNPDFGNFVNFYFSIMFKYDRKHQHSLEEITHPGVRERDSAKRRTGQLHSTQS